MDLLDLLRIGLRWLHALAAVTWVGGSLFFWLVLRPALNDVSDNGMMAALSARIGKEFQGLVRLAIGVLVLTGALLGADRLSQSDVVSALYVGLLALKVTLAVGMFWLTLQIGRRGSAGMASKSGVSPQTLVLILGLVVYVLAEALKVVFERALRGEL